MSGFSSQGVGAAACASADVASALSAAASRNVFIENLVIAILPKIILAKIILAKIILAKIVLAKPECPLTRFLNKSRTPFSRQYNRPVAASRVDSDFVISRCALRDYVRLSA